MSKISELSDGGSLQSTDYLIAVRSGGNVKVRPNGAVSGTTGQFSTSLNVDGTVTADGLTVEKSGAVGATINRTTSSGATVAVQVVGSTVGTLGSDTGGNGRFDISSVSGGASSDAVQISHTGGTPSALFASNGDISFYEDTGTTPKFFWDASAESLGIGTTTTAISSKLQVASTTTALDSGGTIFASTTDSPAADIGGQVMMGGYYTGTSVAAFGGMAAKKSNATDGNYDGYLQFLTSTHPTGNTEKMRIDASGNVGIGTASPGVSLHVDASGGGAIRASRSSVSANYVQMDHDGTNGTIRASGANALIFDTSSGERARIDASGNLLVGKTSSDLGATAGIELNGQYDVGYFTRSAEKALVVNRLSTDGPIADFRKDGTTVGSIGAKGGTAYFIGSSKGLRVSGSGLIPITTAGANSDATYDIGDQAVRFKDLYLSGGVYLGGTGAANLLDDYEEGTWTPSVTAGSISGTSISYTGKYVKVGDMVTFTFHANSTTGDIQVSSYVTFGGLPFTLSNHATSTVVTEDIDIFARQGFATAAGTALSLSACGSLIGTNDLFVSVTGKISA